MKNWKCLVASVALGWGWGGGALEGVARGQVFERDTTITGPRGRFSTWFQTKYADPTAA